MHNHKIDDVYARAFPKSMKNSMVYLFIYFFMEFYLFPFIYLLSQASNHLYMNTNFLIDHGKKRSRKNNPKQNVSLQDNSLVSLFFSTLLLFYLFIHYYFFGEGGVKPAVRRYGVFKVCYNK